MIKVFLYKKVKEKVIQNIEDYTFSPGKKIPSERSLEEEWKYNRMTIKRAINELVKEGVLYRIHGSGTFVSKIPSNYKLDVGGTTPNALNMNIRTHGMKSSNLVTSFKLVYEEKDIIAKFDKYNEFYELVRVRYADEEPVSMQYAYFPFRLFKDAHRVDFSEQSLYDYMDHRGLEPRKFKKYLNIVKADGKQSKYLQVPIGASIYLFEYLGYTEKGIIVEYTKSYFRADKVAFSFTTYIR